MEDIGGGVGLFNRIDRGEDEEARKSTFAELKVYCLDLLDSLQNPSKTPSSLTQLHIFLSRSSPSALQPFFDYALFPLLLLLDAAVHSRSPLWAEKSVIDDTPKAPIKVSDIAAEGVLQCLEELLTKCHLGSVEQMVVVLKKLTYGAMLSPSEASEEFREGVIRLQILRLHEDIEVAQNSVWKPLRQFAYLLLRGCQSICKSVACL
ncbi:hypothetical protein NMG60_11001953 [Bertholletia excelsa]